MVALVTGGGRGIGRGIALRMAKEGWKVAITSRSAGELSETMKLGEGHIFAVPADVSQRSAVKALVRAVEDSLGPVDLLVNNAATGGPFGPFWESNPEEWWRTQEINMRGPMLVCRELLNGMIARQSGRIVNIVSGAGCQAYSDMSSYVVSKTALIRFSEQLALELKPHGISVFALRPGLVRTAMSEEARHKLPLIQQLFDRGLENSPDAVAELVLTLASGAVDALSGRLFSVGDDVDEMVRRADRVIADDLQLLRARNV